MMNDDQHFSPDDSEYEAPAFVDEEPVPERRTRPQAPAPAPRPTRPPAPTEQSGFVNPALARIAATRSRDDEREPGEIWLGIRTLVIVSAAALISAFIFNYWMPDNILSQRFTVELQAVSSTQGPPTPIPSPLPTMPSIERIGIITGHSGPPLDPQFEVDPGAVCDDGLTELSINTAVSAKVRDLLVSRGYQVEMLEEYDERIVGYRGTVLISIHTNTCQDFTAQGGGATGFNVEGNSYHAAMSDRDSRLAECIAASYAGTTGLPRHYGRPPDLVEYHVFRKISVDTPMAVVELGFMAADRPILLDRQDDMARGIADGIECFLRPTAVPGQPTAIPEAQTGS